MGCFSASMCAAVSVFLLIFLMVPNAYAGKYALVIGNGSYRHPSISALATPVNDANVMSETLKSLGFSVKKETDVSKPDMKKAIRDFGTRLSPGETALFYFSGHGAQAEGSNYLIPIGADIQSEDEISDQSIPAEMVLEKMKTARSAVNIIILDACSNNPFKGFKSLKEGLAPMSAVKGSFIAYATAPGTVAWTGSGSTSIYTDYLVKTMKIPGLKIEDVFKRVREAVISETGDKQIPWEASSLTGGDFFFAGGNPPPPPIPVPVTDSKRFTNSIGQEFVYIEPGTFMMGSPENEPGRDSDENQHRVTLTKGFYMQTTEVTQGQWKKIMGNNPSDFKECGDNCPVEKVSWEYAQEFIKKLSRKEGKEYRLPTEAEWEYAARAGTQTVYHWGNQADCSRMMFENDPGSSEIKCVDYVKGRGLTPDSTAPVKSYPANPWGLYDMHGNVWEWCQYRYGAYPADAVTDPAGPSSGSDRVNRGGGWDGGADYCRSDNRDGNDPGGRYYDLGFRVLAVPAVGLR